MTAESLNWTAQPTNPIMVRSGQDVSLTWNYSLTSYEQNNSQTLFMVRWRKFDLGTSSFDVFATYVKITGSSAAYRQPNAPRIVVDRSTGNVSATLQFKNVKLEDAGIYKVEVSVGWFPGPVTIADQEFYFIVLGKGCTLHKFEMSLLIIITGHSFMHTLRILLLIRLIH